MKMWSNNPLDMGRFCVHPFVRFSIEIISASFNLWCVRVRVSLFLLLCRVWCASSLHEVPNQLEARNFSRATFARYGRACNYKCILITHTKKKTKSNAFFISISISFALAICSSSFFFFFFIFYDRRQNEREQESAIGVLPISSSIKNYCVFIRCYFLVC